MKNFRISPVGRRLSTKQHGQKTDGLRSVFIKKIRNKLKNEEEPIGVLWISAYCSDIWSTLEL